MKQHTVVITIKGSPTSNKVDMSLHFDPPINQKNPKKSNCLESIAAKILRSATQQ